MNENICQRRLAISVFSISAVAFCAALPCLITDTFVPKEYSYLTVVCSTFGMTGGMLVLFKKWLYRGSTLVGSDSESESDSDRELSHIGEI